MDSHERNVNKTTEKMIRALQDLAASEEKLEGARAEFNRAFSANEKARRAYEEAKSELQALVKRYACEVDDCDDTNTLDRAVPGGEIYCERHREDAGESES